MELYGKYMSAGELVVGSVAVLGLSVWGASGGMVFGRGHSIGTTTGILLRTILCKSLVLMPRVKFVEKYTKHAC